MKAMIFPNDLVLSLSPALSGLRGGTYGELLERAVSCDFELHAFQRAIDSMLREGTITESQLRSTTISDNDLLLSDSVYFPTGRGWYFGIHRAGNEAERFDIQLDDEDVAGIGELLRLGARSNDRAEFCDVAADLGEELLDALTLPGPLRPTWRAAKEPGIYRREHASLLIRSETTSVLIDPIGWSQLCRAPATPNDESIDAVVITHSHGDHIHWPSALMAARNELTPVITPVVPRMNLLTIADFAVHGSALGLNVIPLAWNDTHVVGDIRIQALPFYGEQPTVDAPGSGPVLRSWGNCYRITTPQMSVALLVDSGKDPLGDMKDVLLRSVAEHGPVDAVASCLRIFDCPFFGGLETYFATLPLYRLRELFAQFRANTLPSTTAGPQTVAALCGIAGARYFLPYAHGFEGLGRTISDIGWGDGEASEAGASAQVEGELRRLGHKTEVVDWMPGASAHMRDGSLIVDKTCG